MRRELMALEIEDTIENAVKKTEKEPLVIFKTEEDKYGRDITVMSDFFEGYVQQMSLALSEQSKLELISDLPVADFGILSDVIHHADVLLKGNVTLIPDFDNLPADIKSKLKKGIYSVGESKQVDGNHRAVILDENAVRIKDITLKKAVNNPGTVETVRSIGNQIQMRQIYAKLADIQEFQTYQLEKDRDRDIVVPFLDARSIVLEAEHKSTQEEKIRALKAADEKIRTALNAVYADLETTTRAFARRTSIPFLQFGNQINTYMSYITSDFQIATKYVGVRMQLLEYMGETKVAKEVLQSYQHVVYDFLEKPVTKKGLSAATLMHDYFPYDRKNLNCWYTFSKEMKPALESSMNALELSMNENMDNEIYVVSVEDCKDE